MNDVAVVNGNLLDVVDVDAVVNAWNRNVVPWWLLIPRGVSAAIKDQAGLAPFRELARHGPIPLGRAVTTGAGCLPYKGIIHVAAISMAWRATEATVYAGTRAALEEARTHRFGSLAFPVLGAGSGGLDHDRALAAMLGAIRDAGQDLRVIVVRYTPKHR